MEQVSLDAYILDALLPDLMGHDRKPAALAVYLALYREGAKGNWSVRRSHQAIAEATGLSRSAVQSALAHLKKRQLISTSRANPTAVPLHRVNRPWRRLERGS
jgi:DNA-binding MarR family transcriptional regulator